MFDINVLSFQYVYVYVVVNFFCAVLSLLFLSKFSVRVGNNHEIHLFRAMIISYLMYLVLEIVWILALSDLLPLPLLATGLIKMADTMLVPFTVYFWFWFAEERFHSQIAKNRSFRIALSIPILLMCILYATSFFTGIVFRISPQRTVEAGPLIILTGIVDNFYGIAIILHAAILYWKDKNHYRRKDYWAHIAFIVLCTVAGILDVVVKTTPVMTLTIAFSFAYMFVNLVEPHIYNAYSDALTGLHNRRHADRYLTEGMQETSPENPFYLFMADVDRFKEINDTLGHMEGDQALKTVAEAIAAVAKEFRGFAARWGGDEFLVMVRRAKKEDFPMHFASVLDEKIKQLTDRHNSAYPLTLSIGHAVCDSSSEKIANVIQAADQMLYQKKKEKLSGYKA